MIFSVSDNDTEKKKDISAKMEENRSKLVESSQMEAGDAKNESYNKKREGLQQKSFQPLFCGLFKL